MGQRHVRPGSVGDQIHRPELSDNSESNAYLQKGDKATNAAAPSSTSVMAKARVFYESRKRNEERTETILPLLSHDAFLHVLSFVPGRDLVRKCRLVNKNWKDAVDAPHIWISKLQREWNEERPLEADMLKYGVDIKMLYVKRTFRDKNFLKNWQGSHKSRSWQIVSNGGDGFQLEPASSPHGSEPLPPELGCENCWATSYGNCTKRQLVDLRSHGCDPAWFDKVQPHIEISVWLANRFDCAAVYKLQVALCGEDRQPLTGDKFIHNHERRTQQWADNSWEKHTYVFKEYGPGVRYIMFQHTGADGQFWAGHFGPKMAAPCVRLLPKASEVS